MARYIDADKFAERIKVSPAFYNINDGLLLQRVVIDLLNNIPTADVAPKSEVAREIFAEIELFLNKAIDGWRKERGVAYNDRQIEMIDFRNGAFKYCLHEIAELKKKYTGEQI